MQNQASAQSGNDAISAELVASPEGPHPQRLLRNLEAGKPKTRDTTVQRTLAPGNENYLPALAIFRFSDFRKNPAPTVKTANLEAFIV
jgi:hypothetical protein